jgi:hypothetical protein
MIDPITGLLVLGPQVVSGGLQWWESKQAREYAEEKERELQAALNKIGIPEARPEYFTPEVYAWLENYNPEVAAYVRERDPNMVKMQSAEAQRAKNAEQQVLQSMLDRSREGTDVMAEIQRARGMREAAGTMASQSATLQQQLQRQGQQGGLAAYGAALQQQQGAGQQAALAGEQAALSGLQERGRALTEAGGLSGRQLNRELDIERGNVNAINAFNQRLAQSQQDQANLAAEIRNQGNMFNIRGRQTTADKNVASKASARDRQMDFDQQQYMNQLAKYGKGADLSKSSVDRRYGAAGDTNRAIQGIADVVSTGGYINAGYTPKGFTKQSSPGFQFNSSETYDIREPENDPYAKWRLPRREI